MYEHYERHRTDNITDPALRRAHPISTISGWDRDHDQSTDGPTKNGQAMNDKAITNTRSIDAQTMPEKSTKVSKSEQTDEVVLEDVKCICEENASQDETNVSNSVESKEPSAQPANATATEPKPVQSISSISQVYNEQLTGQAIVCNGDAEHASSDETTTPIKASADGSTSGSDALRKTLEIDSYEDNKEIVDEIVEEILAKSEILLDDCKRSLDDNHVGETETTSSPVIKDEEIEHAVSEVVKGVLNIERKVRRDSETDTEKMCGDVQAIDLDADTVVDEPTPCEVQSDNQKTDLVLSNAAPQHTDAINDNESVPATDDIKDIVATIVNDVIENCVNQTATDVVCDNDKSKMSIIDNINNNSSDVATNDSNDNAIIVDQPEVVLSNETIEETNEEIIKGIVNEIVDKCVESEANAASDNDDNNNNSHNADQDASLNKSGSEAMDATTMDESSNDDEQLGGVAKIPAEPALENPKNRSQGTSISTSTQVENNHFGELNCQVHFECKLIYISILM